MNTITVQLELPEAAASFLERQVSEGRFRDVSQYLSALVQLAQQRQEAEIFEEMLMEGCSNDNPAAYREAKLRAIRDLVQPAIESLDRGEGVPADEVFRKLRERRQARE